MMGESFAQVIAYDPLTGFRVVCRPGDDAQAASAILNQLGLQPANGAAPAGLDLFSETLQRLVTRGGEPIALIADFASRLVVRSDVLSAPEHQAFTRALVLSQQTRSRPHGSPPRPFYATPRTTHGPAPNPAPRSRRPLAVSSLRGFGGFKEASPQAADEAVS